MKRTLAFLLAAVMMLALLPALALADKPITINVMIENRSDTEHEGFMKCLVEPFLAEHPEIEINWMPTPDNMNVIKIQMAAGQGADLCFTDGPTAAKELADAGRILDMTKYFEKYGWDEIIDQWALNMVNFDGHYYAIPTEIDSMWMFYNTDLFAEYGWTPPTNYEELCKVADESIANGYTAMAFGNSSSQSDIDHWLTIAYNMYAGAADMKAGLKNELKWNEGNLKGAIERLNEMWQKGYINDRQSYAVSKNDARTLFYTGRATMKMDGSWFYAKMLAFGEVNYEIAPLPTLRDDVNYNLPVGIGEAIVINANAKEEVADACAELLNFMLTRPDLHLEQVINYGISPMPISFPLDAFPADVDPHLMAMLQYTNEATASEDGAGMVVWCAFPTEMRNWQIQNMDKVFMGTMTVDEFCDGTQKVFEKCFAEGSVPNLP